MPVAEQGEGSGADGVRRQGEVGRRLDDQPGRGRLTSREAERLATIDGVAQVQVYGSMKYAVRIQLDPQQLAAALRNRLGFDE